MNSTIEEIIAKNLVDLRKFHNLKQSDLSEKICYSDKTISRWENGSSTPDITALSKLAEFYNVSIDDLTKENILSKVSSKDITRNKDENVNKISMISLLIATVWLIATIVYIAVEIINTTRFWQVFVWAVPISSFIAFRFNKTNQNIKWLNMAFLSVTVCSLITAIYLQLLQYNLWQLFLVIIPIEAMVVIATLLKK